jgi:hypothetical protein
MGQTLADSTLEGVIMQRMLKIEYSLRPKIYTVGQIRTTVWLI